MYSLVFVAIMRLITPEKMAFYSGIISSVFALANLLGPILGGVIVDNIVSSTCMLNITCRASNSLR
jgi:MFS family permease